MVDGSGQPAGFLRAERLPRRVCRHFLCQEVSRLSHFNSPFLNPMVEAPIRGGFSFPTAVVVVVVATSPFVEDGLSYECLPPSSPTRNGTSEIPGACGREIRWCVRTHLCTHTHLRSRHEVAAAIHTQDQTTTAPWTEQRKRKMRGDLLRLFSGLFLRVVNPLSTLVRYPTPSREMLSVPGYIAHCSFWRCCPIGCRCRRRCVCADSLINLLNRAPPKSSVRADHHTAQVPRVSEGFRHYFRRSRPTRRSPPMVPRGRPRSGAL